MTITLAIVIIFGMIYLSKTITEIYKNKGLEKRVKELEDFCCSIKIPTNCKVKVSYVEVSDVTTSQEKYGIGITRELNRQKFEGNKRIRPCN